MPEFIEQKSILLVLLLLCFGGSLTAKCVSINNQPCMLRPMVVTLSNDINKLIIVMIQINFITIYH